jgi:branched-chain amino acid transport system ATP-binding protein
MSGLVIRDLEVKYGKVSVLQELSLRVDPRDTVAIIGPNGAGKTTLADTIAGLKAYDSGSVEYNGTEVEDVPTKTLVKNGLIYSSEHRDLFDQMLVRDNLELGAYRNRDNLHERLALVFDIFPRLEERATQRAGTLSGGEQQMLAIGRSLMGNPNLLILDEPTLGLAPVIIEDIGEALEEFIELTGLTIVLCEQNASFAMKHADKVFILEEGKAEQELTPEELRESEEIVRKYIGE